MTDALTLKFESGSLDWTTEELAQLEPWMQEQIEADLLEEAEHQALLA